MYLKSLDMIGFKSFADNTKLEFQPGMTAIVGPNGCGKSNVADAVRWVLGEQSAKAMRASKMEDCIFNGTDNRKPLGMAEVSITFADCEQALGLEYHEVTITRRVFRSGEGQYFLNKTPCRLKDIQRLFLGTGVGTTSYSLMEQGQIDKVLSSHPEDRRTIFEEASGITKFKADKKEAIRKLEYTEANLLRLADVIREVKRQIGSLQRQAGKARRYKELREELRKFDVHVSKNKLCFMDAEINRLKDEISASDEKVQSSRDEVAVMEQENAVLRKTILQSEHEIGSIMEKGMEARSKLEHTEEMIQVNQRQIDEYLALSNRDTLEIDKTRKQLEEQRQSVTQLTEQIEKARTSFAEAEKELKDANGAFANHQQQVDSMRRTIQELRTESVEMESHISKLQNQLTQMESQEHSDAIRRERLFAEQAQLDSVVKRYQRRQSDMKTELETCKTVASVETRNLEQLLSKELATRQESATVHKTLIDLRSQASVMEAQIEMLAAGDADSRGQASSSKLIMDKTNPLKLDTSAILGFFVSHLTVESGFSGAVEAVLKTWLDAIVVRDRSTAINVMALLQQKQSGPARILILESIGSDERKPVDPAPGSRLADHVKAPDEIAPIVRRLLGNVIVVESLADVPAAMASHGIYVTKSGALIRGDGYAEYWMQVSRNGAKPSRLDELTVINNKLPLVQKNIVASETSYNTLNQQETTLVSSIKDARVSLEEKRHDLAVKEGEFQIVSGETDQAKDRLNTVTWELNNLSTGEDIGPSRRSSIAAEIDTIQAKREGVFKQVETNTRKLLELENNQGDLQAEVTQKSVRFAQMTQEVEHLGIRHGSVKNHLAELDVFLKDRSEGLSSHQKHIDQLKTSISTGERQLVSLKEVVEANTAKAGSLRTNMEKQVKELDKLESDLNQKKTALDSIRNAASGLGIKLTETTMRRQNQIDRVTSEYNITEAHLMEEAEPAWEGEKPAFEAMETMIAELRTKIEAMGPVNLIAIEEYQELEERYNFLTQQEQDLINAKQQLLDMIKKINITTSEMFATTFAAVNQNFQTMFTRLFNGGSAKLVLVNEEDVLECGIEIIARPPGKRLQNITLLSGGERTLTAVALLFAIYMIKPSPFCLLDELDAPLDESNIGRFVSVLQDFLQQSQFVVITHNRQTMSAANILYGITMPEKGCSKMVSMKFNEQKTKTFEAHKKIAAEQAPAPVTSNSQAPEDMTSPETEV